MGDDNATFADAYPALQGDANGLRNDVTSAMCTAFLLVEVFTGISGSLLVSCALYTNKNLRTPVNALIVNLAIVGLLTSVTCSPVLLWLMHGSPKLPPRGERECTAGGGGDGDHVSPSNATPAIIGEEIFMVSIIEHAFYVLCGSVQAITIASISFERYQAIANPFDKVKRIKRIKFTLFLSWLVGVVCSALYVAVCFLESKRGPLVHPFLLTEPLGVSFIIFAFIPFSILIILVILVFYVCIIVLVREHAAQSDKSLFRRSNKVAPVEDGKQSTSNTAKGKKAVEESRVTRAKMSPSGIQNVAATSFPPSDQNLVVSNETAKNVTLVMNNDVIDKNINEAQAATADPRPECKPVMTSPAETPAPVVAPGNVGEDTTLVAEPLGPGRRVTSSGNVDIITGGGTMTDTRPGVSREGGGKGVQSITSRDAKRPKMAQRSLSLRPSDSHHNDTKVTVLRRSESMAGPSRDDVTLSGDTDSSHLDILLVNGLSKLPKGVDRKLSVHDVTASQSPNPSGEKEKLKKLKIVSTTVVANRKLSSVIERGANQVARSVTNQPASDKSALRHEITICAMDGTTKKAVVENPDVCGAICVMNPQNRERGKRRMEAKTAKVAAVVMCIFVICCLPFPIVVLVTWVYEASNCQPHWTGLLQDLHLGTLTLAILATAVNPLAYGMANRQMRAEFKKVPRKMMTVLRKRFVACR